MKYRAEIDGLRAVAVVPVILVHAGFEIFSGGFVGVDIFFVISGYLITSIIVSELEQNKFSLLTFYERRARRILPALFFVLIACLPFAWMWLSTFDMIDFAQSLLAVLTFSSNILFWHETGYFSTEAELKPLLHTWSLAVEEQYYIFFPLFLMFMWRFGLRWILGLIAAAFFISLGLGHWGAVNYPTAAFFLLPTRAWELLIGVFAALYMLNLTDFHQRIDHRIHQGLSLLGLTMVVYSIFVFDKGTLFPGLPALVPTVGTGLIILFATQDTWVNRLLSIKGLVGIGLISYSAYLWHQPILAFTRHRSLTEPSEWLMGLLCIVILVMAYISWRFVEQPFRQKQEISSKFLLSTGTVMASLIIAAGLVGHIEDGLPSRWSDEAQAALSVPSGDTSGCHNRLSYEDIENDKVCQIGADKTPRIAVIGDSHASHLTDALSTQLKCTNIQWKLVRSTPGAASSRDSQKSSML
jgi:peptidoglycan/LPS O-acetylase OafA/YrhL